MTIELPIMLDLASDRELQLALNVDRIFEGIAVTEETNSTHSRTNDTLAMRLRQNVELAFSVVDWIPITLPPPLSKPKKPLIADNATPYPFQMSAFFPQPALPSDNPLTEEGVELGNRLFSDPLLSVNNSQSCASCHDSKHAFSESRTVSIGAEGKPGTRNAMPLLNLAWKSAYFWDGRAATLREQVLQPIENPVEMHETLTNIVAKLRSSQPDSHRSSDEGGSKGAVMKRSLVDYPLLFARAFGTAEITADRVARALEQFLLAQTSFESKFDRVLRGEAKLSEEEQRGFQLFHTEYDPRREQYGADCFHCHGGPLFQNQSFANNGLDSDSKDRGRSIVTGKQGDIAKFAVPSLRNVEVSGPYMHDGRFQTLEEVIEHYSTGVKRSATLDPNLAKHPAGGVPLSPADKRALVTFLKTLTDERFTKVNDLAINH